MKKIIVKCSNLEPILQCVLNAQKWDCIFLREAISNSCGSLFICILQFLYFLLLIIIWQEEHPSSASECIAPPYLHLPPNQPLLDWTKKKFLIGNKKQLIDMFHPSSPSPCLVDIEPSWLISHVSPAEDDLLLPPALTICSRNTADNLEPSADMRKTWSFPQPAMLFVCTAP